MTGFLHFIKVGGFVMYPLLAISIAAIAVIVERLIAYRQLGGIAPGLLPEVIKLCRAGQFDQALKHCESRLGPLAACLSMILRHRGRKQASGSQETAVRSWGVFLHGVLQRGPPLPRDAL